MTESDVKQIKKGILKILILKLLQQEKKYGYELKEGTLYPILYKLEEDGLVISEWEIPHDKMRVKKYYSITQKGKDELKELIVFWNLLSTKVQDFLLEDNEYEE